MDIRSAAMGIAFVLMWSSAFSSARIIATQAPPLTMLSLRFLISGLIAIAIAKALGQSMRLSRTQLGNTIIFGICQNGLYLGLFFVAMQWIGAGLAAIIASSMPLLVALLNRVFLKERTGWIGTLGLLVGFGGVAVIMSGRLSGSSNLIALVFCTIGVLALAIATLVVRKAASGGNILMIVGMQMLVGAVALIVPALAFETMQIDWTLSLGLALAYTIFVPGLTATWIWFMLVDRIGSIRAATYHFLNPFFGVAIAALILGESLSIRDFVGVVIITAGILAVQISKRPKPVNVTKA